MKHVILSLLLLVALFAAAASVKGASTSTCVAKCLTNTVHTGARFTKKQVVQCIEDTCARPMVTKARTYAKRRAKHQTLDRMALKLNRVAQGLLDKKLVVQEKEQVNEVKADTMSDSSITRGDMLIATTNIIIRSGPCNDVEKSGTLSPGQSKKFTGKVQSGCGYTWYSVDNGWVKSKEVNVVQPCNPVRYPKLEWYKQCDARWKDEPLGPSTFCLTQTAGSLFSSIAMALNGMGKRISELSGKVTEHNEVITPASLFRFLKNNHGWIGGANDFYWNSLELLGLLYKGTHSDKNYITGQFCSPDKVIILNVSNSGRWVLATGMSEDKSSFSIKDPGSTKTSIPVNEVSRGVILEVSPWSIAKQSANFSFKPLTGPKIGFFN